MKRFARAHRLLLIFLAVILPAGIILNIFMIIRADQELARSQSVSTTSLAAMDKTLAKLKADKAAKDAAAKKKTEEDAAAKSKAAATADPIAVPADGGAHSNPASIDVVVNKKHPINPINYAPSLQTVSCGGNGSATIQVQAASDFSALCAAAAAAGQPLGVSSSYRSYSEQVSTYNYWVSVSGQSGADTYSARPGYSEHQTGLAVDLRVPGGPELSEFTGTSQQQWLAANAYKYGFIQRYTAANTAETGYTAETWHFRYIGREAAAAYTLSGASSLERYWGVSGGGY